MIDPSKITVDNASDQKLEELILFWITAAGKNGHTAARCLENLMQTIGGHKKGPFRAVLEAKDLPELLRTHGIGCYTNKARSYKEVAASGLDLRTCTPDDLEKIYGIGMKTSRCFVLHSRPGARYAGLDTHILKYLRANNVKDVPKSTPTSKKQYKRLEQEFLRIADIFGKSPTELDLEVWNWYSVK